MADFDDGDVRRFRNALMGKLYQRGVARGEADDIIQETLLRTLKILRSGQPVGSLGALVNSVCENVLKEWWRSGKRTESLEDDVVEFPSGEDSPLVRVLREESAAGARSVLAELSPKDAAILRALFIEERDKDEVCREHGIDRAYLRVLVFRAKERFRDRMKRNPPRRH